jgi:hypothetical protein
VGIGKAATDVLEDGFDRHARDPIKRIFQEELGLAFVRLGRRHWCVSLLMLICCAFAQISRRDFVGFVGLPFLVTRYSILSYFGIVDDETREIFRRCTGPSFQ